MTCPMCGSDFVPASACAACPLNGTCAEVCCPGCGYGIVDVERSRVVRLGRRLRITRMSAAVAARVEPYGLEHGRIVDVLQRKPVTVVRVDELELALEPSIAAEIEVEPA